MRFVAAVVAFACLHCTGVSGGPTRSDADNDDVDATATDDDADPGAGDDAQPTDGDGPGDAGAPTNCADTPIGQLAATLNAGEVAELTSAGLSQQLFFYNGGPHSILGYASKGVWDPRTCQALFTGAGHLETTKLITYSATTNTWSEGPNPSWWCENNGENPYTCFRHAYGFNTIDPATGRYFYFDFQMRVQHTGVVNPLTQTWTEDVALPSSETGSSYSGLEYMPSRHSLIFYSYNNAGLMELADGSLSWTPIQAYPTGPYHTYVVGNPDGETIIFGGGNGSYDFYLFTSNGTVTPIADPPRTFHPAPDDPGTVFQSYVGDPASTRYVALGLDGAVSIYDPDGDTWSAVTFPLTGTVGVPIPIPDLDVILLINDTGHTYLFKAPR